MTGIPSGGAVAAADTAVDVVTNEIPQTEAAGQHLKELGSPENPAVNPTGEVHTKLRADGFPTEETPGTLPPTSLTASRDPLLWARIMVRTTPEIVII